MESGFLRDCWSWIGYGAQRVMRKGIALIVFIFALAQMAAAEPIRIIGFGDSLTAGYGLPIENGFTSQLQTWLRDQGRDVIVINAGVSGDTTAGGLARIAWTLGEPADAIIVELGANDMLRALDPDMTRENLSGILKVASEQGMPIFLAGMRAPGNYGTDYSERYNSIFPDLAQEYGAWYYPQFLQGLSAAGETIADISKVVQSDGLHPTAEGVALIVEDIGPEILKWIESFDVD